MTKPEHSHLHTSATKRIRKVYRIALPILFKYLWLFFIKKFISNQRYQQKSQALHQHSAQKIASAFRELEGAAGTTLAVLFPFDLSRISLKKVDLAKLRVEVLVDLDQGSRQS